jgi:hypothetical protein
MSARLGSLVWFSNCARQLRWLRSRIARLDVLDAVAESGEFTRLLKPMVGNYFGEHNG